MKTIDFFYIYSFQVCDYNRSGCGGALHGLYMEIAASVLPHQPSPEEGLLLREHIFLSNFVREFDLGYMEKLLHFGYVNL